MRNMRLKAALGMAGVLAMTAACCVVGPALAADSASTADEIVRGGEPDGDVQYPGKEYIVENYDKWDKIAEEYAPEIIRYSNGQLVQRTPTEYECPIGCSKAGPFRTTRTTSTRTTEGAIRAMLI